MSKKEMQKLEKQLYEIAAARMAAVDFRGHLEELHNDRDDFIEVPVWGLMDALKAAYELGKSSK